MMNPKQQRGVFWPVLAIVGGGVLITLELLPRFSSGSQGWFWLLIGGALVVLGAIELVSRSRRR